MKTDLNESYNISNAVDVMVLNKDETHVLLGIRGSGNKAGIATWCFPGGHQKDGETILEAAKREVEEEIGKDAKIIIYKKVIAVRENKLAPYFIQHNTVILKGIYQKGEIKTPLEIEMKNWKWFPINNLPKNLFSGIKEIVDNYRAGKVKVVSDF